MIRVKLTWPHTWPIIKQTPNRSGVWGNCKFYINEGIEECDFWVVFDGLKKEEKTYCPKGNTLLITAEPPSIKGYHPEFVKQFDQVITSHKNISHPKPIYMQQGLNWMVGGKYIKETKSWDKQHSKDYDELKEITVVKKSKLLSVVVSSKAFTKVHEMRLKFIDELKKHFKDDLDIFGIGFREIPDKWDAISPYKYHIAIENSVVENYWTEKLSDAFLGESYPFYYGCPNIFDYFNHSSLSLIEIKNFKHAISEIEKNIVEDTYEKSKTELQIAKNKILDQYNIFPLIQRFCNETLGSRSQNALVKLKPESAFSAQSNSKIWKKLKFRFFDS